MRKDTMNGNMENRVMIQEVRDVMKMIGEVMESSSAEAPKRRGRRPKSETKAVQAIPPPGT